MQSRRWWIVCGAVLMAAGSVLGQQPAPLVTATAPADKPAKVADEITTNMIKGGTSAIGAADALATIAKANVTTAVWLDKFMQEELIPRFEQRIFKTTAGAPANVQVVAIVAEVTAQQVMLDGADILSFDKAFTTQLSNPNAGVRYWAAKGLARLAAKINKTGGNTKKSVAAALTTTAAGETSLLVQAQILNALGQLGDVATVNATLAKNSARFKVEPMSTTDLEALSQEIKALPDLVKSAGVKGKDLTDLISSAAQLSSYAAQHAANAGVQGSSESLRLVDGAKDLANVTVVFFNAVSKPGTFAPISGKGGYVGVFNEVQEMTHKTLQATFKDVPVVGEIGPDSSTSKPK